MKEVNTYDLSLGERNGCEKVELKENIKKGDRMTSEELFEMLAARHRF